MTEAQLIKERYEALEVVGRGGQGEVIRALDHLHRRQVALKVRAVASEAEREAVLSEARVVLGLKPHPLLPLVRDDFLLDDSYCLVMDWVEGMTLQQLLDQQGNPGLPIDDVIRWLTDVAEAVDHLHAHEPAVLHGDVKPANVILTAEGRAMLVDFGVARRAGTSRNGLYGTRGYTAPELARGEASSVASDVFALAATAFALLTGDPPRPGAQPQWRKVAGDRANLVALAMRRALAFDPARRPARAGALIESMRAEPSSPSNLPLELTTFVGREAEIAQVRSRLATTRLLTLSGAGGVGKSRLALHVAAEVAGDHADGAFVVELAPLSDRALVPQYVLSALRVPEEPGREHLETLVGHLVGRHLLLVFDGCEHLLPACAALAETLLRSCPKVRILATSREPFRIAGELTWRVPSLTLPDPGSVSPEDLERFDAVRLFVDRAVQSRPDFAVNHNNAAAVAQVCHQLDGIPLALELAATRIKVLTCEQIAARLGDRFRLLTGGSRTALPRHQTLRAAVDWSYDALSDGERTLFRRLSVFAGGFTLEAAEAVCAGEGQESYDILDQLAHLVDKSLVVVEERGERVRYRLLETLRQYGAERLAEAGEASTLYAGLLDWALREAQRAEPELKGPDQDLFLNLLEDEHDNLRAALTWALDEGNVGDGLRLSVALSRLWLVRGYLAEGRRWLEWARTVSPESTPSERAKAVIAESTLAWHQGDYPAVGPLAEEALRIARELQDSVGEAEALCRLGELATMTGDHKAAWSLFEQSRAAWGRSGAKRGVIQSLNVPLHDLGTLACEKGDFDLAHALFEEALVIARDHGNTMDIVHHLSGLGHVARGQGDYAAARSFYEDSHAMARRLGYKRMVNFTLQYMAGLAWIEGDADRAATLYREALAYFGPVGDVLGLVRCIEGLARVAAARGAFHRVARLAGAAERLRDSMHSPIPPSEVEEYRAAMHLARLRIGPAAFDAERVAGRTITPDEVVRLALDDR